MINRMRLVVICILTSFSVFCAYGINANHWNKVVYYSEFGAVGNGVTDDFDAIIKAHAAANEAGLKVRADAGATYYIGVSGKTAQIQTDTDWGNAKFIIDDSKVAVTERNSNIFNLSSKLPTVQITNVKTLGKNQKKLDLSLLHNSFIVVNDRTTMRYIRYGPNQNNGSPQTDVFVVDKNGNVDMKAPIIWDFNQISSMTAYPIDAETLTISGGHFTTIANQAESRYTYYARGIEITRSNVVIDGVYHTITGELDHGAPYAGFISISNCSDVTVQNCMLSGHKTYVTIGNANTPVSMGSYDISVNRSTNVTFRNCKQLNDIHDTKLWGIFGSNYSKNITFDTVEFSRFDAHMGVANATIKNSVLGHMGINLIGCGIFLVENTKVCGSTFMNLRSDYGSTWEGEIVIRNCEFFPRNGAQADAVLIGGSYSGQHNFGYTCYMPEKITIDGLVINDGNPPNNYQGPKIFASFNNAYTSEAYEEKYPYVITREIEIRDLNVKSGKPLLISNNQFMFRNVGITTFDSSEKNPKPYPGGSGKFTRLVWHDEFNGSGLPDPDKWSYEKGYVRNRELQYYTVERTENAVQRNGNLVITARNDSALIDGAIRPISSASIISKGKGDWKYARVEVRAKLPSCLGTWPAIWMMPTTGVYGGWPRSGEIDVMEHVGYDPEKIHFFLHTAKYNHTKGTGRGTSVYCPYPDKKYHVYAVEWFEDHIDWFLDDKKVFSIKNDGEGWESWPLDQPFYLILNFAFGGAWGAQKGVDLKGLPQEYCIDYVRVFQ